MRPHARRCPFVRGPGQQGRGRQLRSTRNLSISFCAPIQNNLRNTACRHHPFPGLPPLQFAARASGELAESHGLPVLPVLVAWASPPARQARRAVPPKKLSVPPQDNVDTAVQRACSPPSRSSGSGLSHADYRLQPVNWASLTLSSLQLDAPEAGLVAKFENIGSMLHMYTGAPGRRDRPSTLA